MNCLHDYQMDIKVRLAEAWRHHRSVMVQMPTGTGKTHVLAAVVNEELRIKNEEWRIKNEEWGIRNEEWRIKHQRSTPVDEESTEQVDVDSTEQINVESTEPVDEESTEPANGESTEQADGESTDNEESRIDNERSVKVDGDSVPAVAGNPVSVCIIAHRRELVAQIEDTVRRFGMSLEDGRVRVMSIQWLTRHWDDLRAEDSPGLVVIDEAHHAVAETYREMWTRWPGAKFLGLTATPCRMSRRGFTDLFEVLICSWSIAEFIGRGYLSAFDYVTIRQGSETQRLINTLEKRGADGDYQIKEMNNVLNRSTTIGQLFSSMEQYAGGKKGIVYAISIDHARRIAEFYSAHGVNAVPIDSKTPMAVRKQLVGDFKAGRIQVLVNVDIFSEGFDCPDVEFIQLARPTLSLAKYLQQVGRGLRRTDGKDCCVLIDNVGLYRVFGLPTVTWDWNAMFHGYETGKRWTAAAERTADGLSTLSLPDAPTHECDMEVIVAHGQLMAEIERMRTARHDDPNDGELKPWQDRNSGRWGLRRGGKLITDAVYTAVLDTRYGMAAVRFDNRSCGIVDGAGTVVWKRDGCRSMRFLANRLLHVTTYNNKVYYMDLCNQRVYEQRPKVKRYGNVELLETDRVYYSRTKTVYVNSMGLDRYLIHWQRFYLTIYDVKVPFAGYGDDNRPAGVHAGFACILDGDSDSYYWMYCRLADGSIIVADNAGKYYHAAEGKTKEYIGCRDSAEAWGTCRIKIERMTRQAEEKRNAIETERTERRRRALALSDEAVPFRSGVRWGLKVGSRVTVPPIYRSIKSPVGKYCAVEQNYSQWGVVALDGTVMVEPKYSDIEINTQGIVTGTKVTGNKERMKLP